MHILLWINVMFDFIFMRFAELCETGREQKYKIEINVFKTPTRSSHMNKSTHENHRDVIKTAIFMSAP